MSGLIWIQAAWHCGNDPENFFEKKNNFKKKKSADDNDSMKNYPACKELIGGNFNSSRGN